MACLLWAESAASLMICPTKCRPSLQAQSVPALTVKHLAAAAAKARPSIPVAERERLEAIYSKFRGGRDPGFGGVSVSAKGKGKLATLA